MRKMLYASALSVAMAGALWPAAAGASSQAMVPLTLCVSEGAADLSVEGTHSWVTQPLNVTDPDANNQECNTVNSTVGGEYTISAGNFLSAPCYKTVNGEIVNPPTLKSPRANCEGKVYEITVARPGLPTGKLEGPEVSITPSGGLPTTVTFRVTDVRYFECVEDGTTDPTLVCEPDGSTL